MTTDWRERYLELADRHERESAASADAETQITRLITRLCVAVSGLDPLLDPHLDRLRQAARTGDAERLLRQADGITDALVQATDDRSRPDLLRRLLERRQAKRQRLEQILTLWAELAARPARASDAELDRLAGWLGEALAGDDGSADQAPGLLARLIGRAGRDSTDPPNLLLCDALATIAWPADLGERIDDLRDRLGEQAAADAWVGVVREIGGLVVGAIERAQDNARTAESFLSELSQRLEAFDRHMLAEAEHRDAAQASGERLGQRMNHEVVSLSASVRDSASLADLQRSVLGSLDRMQAHVRAHLDEENTRRENAEAEADQLRRQLNRLEQDTFDLRRQVAQTAQQAMRDPLTGLPNRRAYDERVAQEHARWRRFGAPLALLVLDVDDFKKINDTFGHKSGDKTLVMIAKTLHERTRETDFIARYGGEELVMLLTGADPDDAQMVAEAMRAAVESAGLHAHGKPVKVTVSGGLAMFADGDTPERVFERADQALYKAKHQGKNCIVVG